MDITPNASFTGANIDFVGFNPQGVTISCPLVTGHVMAAIKREPQNFSFLLLFGASVSFYDENQTEMVAELKWTDGSGNYVGPSFYQTVAFKNDEQGGAWKNYTALFTASDATPPTSARYMEILLGFGRGDTGIDEDGYIWRYRLQLN